MIQSSTMIKVSGRIRRSQEAAACHWVGLGVRANIVTRVPKLVIRFRLMETVNA